MKLRIAVALLLSLSLLFCGCEKIKEKFGKKDADTTAVQTDSLDTTAAPQIDAAKVTKAIANLPEFSKRIIELSKLPQPTNPDSMDPKTLAAITRFDSLAKANGFIDLQDWNNYVGFVLQVHQMTEMYNNPQLVLENIPADQRSTPDAKAIVDQFKANYEQAKKQIGDPIFAEINASAQKINAFIDEQEKAMKTLQKTQPAAPQQKFSKPVEKTNTTK